MNALLRINPTRRWQSPAIFVSCTSTSVPVESRRRGQAEFAGAVYSHGSNSVPGSTRTRGALAEHRPVVAQDPCTSVAFASATSPGTAEDWSVLPDRKIFRMNTVVGYGTLACFGHRVVALSLMRRRHCHPGALRWSPLSADPPARTTRPRCPRCPRELSVSSSQTTIKVCSGLARASWWWSRTGLPGRARRSRYRFRDDCHATGSTAKGLQRWLGKIPANGCTGSSRRLQSAHSSPPPCACTTTAQAGQCPARHHPTARADSRICNGPPNKGTYRVRIASAPSRHRILHCHSRFSTRDCRADYPIRTGYSRPPARSTIHGRRARRRKPFNILKKKK